MMNVLTVQLPRFEGPLGLLLYLIRKEEMDIMDIQIHKITSQYLEYIRHMRELDLEVAGDFIAMASTLLQIKSRMLLPQYNDQGEIVENEDPRKDLVQKLLEYQKYQEAAKLLYDRPLLGRDFWARGMREKIEGKEDEIILEENALFSLISAYRKALKGLKKRVHKVAAKAQSIASRIMEMKEKLLIGKRVSLSEFINISSENMIDKRRQVLITFLSILELGKLGFVTIFQSDTYQEIYLEAKTEITTAVISRVEEYDALHKDPVSDISPERAQLLLMDQELSIEPKVSLEADGDLSENLEFALSEHSFVETDIEQSLNSSVSDDDGFSDSVIVADEIATDEEILAAELEIANGGFSQEGNV